MEASMDGVVTEAPARPAIRTARKRESLEFEARSHVARPSLDSSYRRMPRHGYARRVEHALFGLILGCVGCVWLGALLAEAARAL